MIGACVIALSLAQNAPGLDPRLTAAFEKHQRGDVAGAKKEFESLVAGSPNDGVLPFAIADFLVRRQDYQGAEPYARKAFELHPELAPTHLLYGACLIFTDQLDAGEKLFRAAVARFDGTTDTPDLVFNLGMACALNNKRLEAADWFKKAIALNAASPLYVFSAAENSLNLGRYDEAEAGFRKAGSLTPRHPDAGWKLAVVLAAKNQLADAEKLFKSSCNEGPPATRYSASYQFAVFLFEHGRAAEAEPLLTRATQARPGDRMAWHYLARTLRALGKKEEAAAALERFHQLQTKVDREETEFLLGLIRAQLEGKPPAGTPPPKGGEAGDKKEGSGGR